MQKMNIKHLYIFLISWLSLTLFFSVLAIDLMDYSTFFFICAIAFLLSFVTLWAVWQSDKNAKDAIKKATEDTKKQEETEKERQKEEERKKREEEERMKKEQELTSINERREAFKEKLRLQEEERKKQQEEEIARLEAEYRKRQEHAKEEHQRQEELKRQQEERARLEAEDKKKQEKAEGEHQRQEEEKKLSQIIPSLPIIATEIEKEDMSKKIRLYDVIPTRNIELEFLYLGQRIFKETYIKKGTVLNEIKYTDHCGYMLYNINYIAPYDCFYVPNVKCKEHAKWYDYGYTEIEPILCEFWKSKEDFENSKSSFKQLEFTSPKYCTTVNNPHTITTSETCYTYLMQDEATGYYKIGMSKNPEYRERTLQCEKPTIVLLASRKYYSRGEARDQERYLHQKYRLARVRGEWFNLTINEVIDVKSSL